MAADAREVLESLRPTAPGVIMDMVEAAGIDVAPWSMKKDGTPAAKPKANPQYCYEWAFGGDKQPTALCVWHRNLKVDAGQIVFEESLRQHALGLDRVAITRDNPAHVKSRARDQAKRARLFDSLLQRAFRKSQPVRVILLTGKPRQRDVLGWDTAQVEYRALDREHWSVVSYSDENGSFKLVRGLPIEFVSQAASSGPRESFGQPRENDKTDQTNSASDDQPAYADQFSIPEAPERAATVGSVFQRSQEVRRRVLERAKGFCEFLQRVRIPNDQRRGVPRNPPCDSAIGERPGRRLERRGDLPERPPASALCGGPKGNRFRPDRHPDSHLASRARRTDFIECVDGRFGAAVKP